MQSLPLCPFVCGRLHVFISPGSGKSKPTRGQRKTSARRRNGPKTIPRGRISLSPTTTATTRDGTSLHRTCKLHELGLVRSTWCSSKNTKPRRTVRLVNSNKNFRGGIVARARALLEVRDARIDVENGVQGWNERKKLVGTRRNREKRRVVAATGAFRTWPRRMDV